MGTRMRGLWKAGAQTVDGIQRPSMVERLRGLWKAGSQTVDGLLKDEAKETVEVQVNGILNGRIEAIEPTRVGAKDASSVTIPAKVAGEEDTEEYTLTLSGTINLTVQMMDDEGKLPSTKKGSN